MPADNVRHQAGESYRTVLFIEDSELDAQLIIRAAQNAEIPLQLRWAQDGLEALQLLGLDELDAKCECEPDLVLCDVKLPKVSGMEVVKAIKDCDRLCHVPVVMFSNSTLQLDVDRCLEFGANDYCFKPFDVEQFTDCIKGIVNRWLAPDGAEERPACLLKSSTES